MIHAIFPELNRITELGWDFEVNVSNMFYESFYGIIFETPDI